MCGIFAYTGGRMAQDILLDGLAALEYRGYDSAGIALGGSVTKAIGAVTELKSKINTTSLATSGIAHLRWATHGPPTELNAHPHTDCTGSVCVMHNGIIENFAELKTRLGASGHTFRSETDTEVIPHLIEEALATGVSLEDAVVATLGKIRGTYGLLVTSTREPETIVTARMGSPVALGVGEGERFIASDATPILPHTREIIFLEDGDIVIVTPTGHRVRTRAERAIQRDTHVIDWSVEEATKGGYSHFMQKEIMEAPEVLKNATRGRLIPQEARVKLGGLESVAERLASINRIIVVGCGTAYYAGLTAEYVIEEYGRVPIEVELASEFRYRTPVVEPGTVVLAVSQSGETLDTLEAVREGKRRGALALGVVNVVGSTIARETDAGVYTHAGPEVGVASTKAFLSQVAVLAMIAVFLGRTRGLSEADARTIVNGLVELPTLAARVLLQSEAIRALTTKYASARNFLFIGRKYSYPIALEGALKLKEVSYVHAEGVSAGEMKHGPLAMIDTSFPTIAVVPQDSVCEKTLGNMIEIKARGGPIIAIATEGDRAVAEVADDVIYLPRAVEPLSPLLSAIALQLFAYHSAAGKGLTVDRPRNLAKSVTVE